MRCLMIILSTFHERILRPEGGGATPTLMSAPRSPGGGEGGGSGGGFTGCGTGSLGEESSTDILLMRATGDSDGGGGGAGTLPHRFLRRSVAGMIGGGGGAVIGTLPHRFLRRGVAGMTAWSVRSTRLCPAISATASTSALRGPAAAAISLPCVRSLGAMPRRLFRVSYLFLFLSSSAFFAFFSARR